jgi:outer membrane lipoprotein-sorting protein
VNKSFLAVVLVPMLVSAGEVPSPEEVLQKALAPATVSYRARFLTTTWRGGQGRAEETLVYFRPPAMTRREFLGPDGAVVRVVVSDGDRETISVPGRSSGMHGAAVKSIPKQLDANRERLLLMKNYRVTAAPDERLAGRRAWGITLTPVDEGKPRQFYAVDAETGVLLRVRRFLPGTDGAEQTVVEDLLVAPPMDDGLFQSHVPSEDHGLEPAFSTPEEVSRASTMGFRPPASLPGGFVLESADFFDVGKNRVLAVRYTDGLAILSLYRSGRSAVFEAPGDHAGPLRSRHWKEGDSYYTLIGDLSDEALNAASLSLRRKR